MAIAYILNIPGLVSSYFELIRKIGQPDSKSKPHITVRYAEILKNKDLTAYENKEVSKIEIIGSGSFGLDSDKSQKNKTVFIECEAEELESIVHKPHFPDSVFHITLYDGNSEHYALKLLKLLKSCQLHFEYVFPRKVNLTKIYISGKRKKSDNTIIEYSKEISDLYKSIFDKEMDFFVLSSASEEDKISSIELILESFKKEIKKYKIINKMFQNRLPLDDVYHLNEYLQIDAEEKKSISTKRNRELGVYITPPELARPICRIATEYLGSKEIDFGDPAVGTGVFFGAMYDLDKDLLSKKIASAIGVEIDPVRASHTELKWIKKGLKVIESDFLRLDVKNIKRNIIIANPPYIRFQKIKDQINDEIKANAAKILGHPVDGRASLYVYFIILAHEWLQQDGISAWLIPSEFMETNYGASLREYLLKKVSLLRIHKFGHDIRQFETALVTSSVIFFKNSTPLIDHEFEVTKGEFIDKPEQTLQIRQNELSAQSKWKFFNRRLEPNGKAILFGEIFNISRGIATGANEYFILDENDLIEYKIPISCYMPILTKSKNLLGEIIESDSNGYPIVKSQFYVFSSKLTEEELLSKHPELEYYLNYLNNSGIRNRYLISRRKIWYEQEYRVPPPFLCTYMGRSKDGGLPIKFIRNKSKAIATNSFILIYPKETIFGKLLDEQKLDLIYRDVLKMLELVDIEEQTRTYSGGLKKVEPADLGKVQITNIPEWLQEILDNRLHKAFD